MEERNTIKQAITVECNLTVQIENGLKIIMINKKVDILSRLDFRQKARFYKKRKKLKTLNLIK